MSAGLLMLLLVVAFVACGTLLYVSVLCERRLDGDGAGHPPEGALATAAVATVAAALPLAAAGAALEADPVVAA